MAAMLGVKHSWTWTCVAPKRYKRKDVARGRKIERREWQRNWSGEYEDPQHVIDRACPKGGPDCQCDKAVQDDTSI